MLAGREAFHDARHEHLGRPAVPRPRSGAPMCTATAMPSTLSPTSSTSPVCTPTRMTSRSLPTALTARWAQAIARRAVEGGEQAVACAADLPAARMVVDAADGWLPAERGVDAVTLRKSQDGPSASGTVMRSNTAVPTQEPHPTGGASCQRRCQAGVSMQERESIPRPHPYLGCVQALPGREDEQPAFPLVSACLEPPARIELATPSLPWMCSAD